MAEKKPTKAQITRWKKDAMLVKKLKRDIDRLYPYRAKPNRRT